MWRKASARYATINALYYRDPLSAHTGLRIKPDYVRIVLYRERVSRQAIFTLVKQLEEQVMAGLPNSGKALQQWQHLFEEEKKVELSRQDSIYNGYLRLGLPTRKHEDWKYTPLEEQHSRIYQQCATINAAQRDALALQIDATCGWCLSMVGLHAGSSDSTQNSSLTLASG